YIPQDASETEKSKIRLVPLPIDFEPTVSLRGRTWHRRLLGLVLPLRRTAAHLSALLPVHGLLDDGRQLVAPHVVADLHAIAPFGALVPAVGLLLREERPAQHRHSPADALQRRVPAGVRQEHPHRLVSQHRLLLAPRRQQRAALHGRHELLWQHGGVAAAAALRRHKVRPDVPHEGVAAVGQPPRELQELRVRHHGDAAVVHVHHGPWRAAAEPVQDAVLLLPKVGAQVGQGASRRDGHALAEEKRADGVQRREDGAHGVQRRGLQVVEGVDHDGVRERQPLDLAHEDVEHDVSPVLGADEAGEVAQLHAVAHAANAVHQGGEVAAGDVRELGVVREGHEAPVDELAVVAVAHEPAGAGRPERGHRHADRPGGVVAERHDAVDDEAGDGGRREVGEEGEEGLEAGGHGGVEERRDVLRGVGVRRREAVGDGGEAEAGHAVERAGATRAEQAAVVELGVDEGDVEAAPVEQLGQLHHRRHVALRRARQAHGVRRPLGSRSRRHQ
ncbi:hypothetical protein U9M48_024986, partial [Paspalum notatum var. saurae]